MSRIEIDVDQLRAHLIDYCGTAACSGFPAAMLDVMDLEHMNGYELRQAAERLGIDLQRFAVNS